MVLALALSSLFATASPTAGIPAPCTLQTVDAAAARGLVCIAETGPNWTFAFAYPRAAAAIPALARQLRERSATARTDFEILKAYAAAHPDERFFHEEVFAVEADLPELLALSSTVAEYAGGAHGWSGLGALIWDRAAAREIMLEDLFADREAARGELARLYCPALIAVRRRKFDENGGRFGGTCHGPPEEAALVVGTTGRVETLRVSHAELDGYAGGRYDVYLPVSRRLIGAMHRRYRGSFSPSPAAPLGCNSSLSDPACEARQRQ